MIVVDVNTIAYLWIPGEMTAYAEQALARDPHWVAPLLWRSEFRNILAGYLRRKTLSLEAATRCIEGAESQLAGHELLVPSTAIMQHVAHSTCSAYDCEYTALAEDLDAILVTSDKHILNNFPSLTTSLRKFVEPGGQ